MPTTDPTNEELGTYLTELLDKELQVASTYLLRSVKARHLGLTKLADKYAEEATEERRHAGLIAKRLCESGMPLETQDGEWPIAPPRQYPPNWPLGDNPVAIQVWHWFAMDEVVEQAVVVRLDEIVNCAEDLVVASEEDSSDNLAPSRPSRDKPTILMLEGIWKQEAEHIAWVQQQMQLMTVLGPENYLATLL